MMRMIIGYIMMGLACFLALVAIWFHALLRVTDDSSQIIASLPKLIDEVVAREAQKKTNQSISPWLTAASKTTPSPGTFLEENGITAWVGEQVHSIKQSGSITLTPIKQLMQGEAFKQYLVTIFEQAPLCSDKELAMWEFALDNSLNTTVPFCQPNTLVQNIIFARFEMAGQKLPDTLDVFANETQWYRFLLPLEIAVFVIAFSMGVGGIWLMSISLTRRYKHAAYAMATVSIINGLIALTLLPHLPGLFTPLLTDMVEIGIKEVRRTLFLFSIATGSIAVGLYFVYYHRARV